MLLTFKSSKYQQHLAQLPKIPQTIENIKTLYNPKDFYKALIQAIFDARQKIYLVALYLEKDQGGQQILEALYQAKRTTPTLEIVILVDWHRAQRGRIGSNSNCVDTNADWYYRMAQAHPGVDVPVYGVPVNTREALGVLHLKGFVFDDKVIYSGASLNDAYLQQQNKYRYDRYQTIRNKVLAETLLNYIKRYLLTAPAVSRLDNINRLKIIEIKHDTRLLRQTLREANYCYEGKANLHELAITPLVGLGKKSLLNKTIHYLLCSVRDHLTLCTPYFNLPAVLARDLIRLLRLGRRVEIIVGDKTANDFYIPENQPFKIIGALPYLYEINLRRFLSRLQRYIDKGQLIARLWKDKDNSFHLKGVWVDQEWQLLTGNNLNPRSWRLDLENALLIHDPVQELRKQRECELTLIRTHTQTIQQFTELQTIDDYPIKIRNFIRRLRRIRIDRLISRII
ncbi:CDP-diacylglycerol--serine O-phosphatidyltransferase [Sodalis endosymbiont of Henestaris halophilus]